MKNNNESKQKISVFSKNLKKHLELLNRRINIRWTEKLRVNLGLFAVSLAISLMLWAFVAWDGNSDGTRSMTANIEYSNLQRGYSIYI